VTGLPLLEEKYKTSKKIEDESITKLLAVSLISLLVGFNGEKGLEEVQKAEGCRREGIMKYNNILNDDLKMQLPRSKLPFE
jgi:hypothetical protein